MGPKKKDGKSGKDSENKKAETKKQPEFPIKDILKLRNYTKERNCFSLTIHPEHVENLKVKQEKKTSSPELTFSEPPINWPPLDVYLPDYNCEVPRITTWKPFTKDHIDEWKFLEEDKILLLIEQILPPCYSELNKQFTRTMIYTVFKWARKNKWDEKKISSLLGMFYNTHNYFLGSTRRNQKQVYAFFKESILLHTIDDPPKSTRILEPLECKSGLLYFCHMYLSLLPLLRVQLLPNYNLRLLLYDPESTPVTPPVELPKKQVQKKKSTL